MEEQQLSGYQDKDTEKEIGAATRASVDTRVRQEVRETPESESASDEPSAPSANESAQPETTEAAHAHAEHDAPLSTEASAAVDDADANPVLSGTPHTERPTVRHDAVARTHSIGRAYTSARKPFTSERMSAAAASEGPHRRSVRDQKAVRSESRRAQQVEHTRDRMPETDTKPAAEEPLQARPGRKSVQRPHVAQREAESNDRQYSGKLTPRLIIELAAPHTWAASTMPVLLAMCLCIADTSAISISTAIILLVICVLMQSAVNTINDYFDYVKGTDTADNQDDPTDAVLVYNDINPAHARNLALIFLGAAFVLGIFMIVRAGWIPLVIALIGAVIVFLYSGGKTPISYLPIGEVVSGVTMGGLIPLACYQVLTLDFSWAVLAYAIPPMIGIALILMTNNTCDIEQDIEANRKTLPVLIGRSAAVTVYRSLLVIWMACIVVLVVVGYPRGWYGLFFMVAAYGPLKALFMNPFTHQSRGGGMAQITSTNVILGMTYAICLLMSAAAFPVL